jgi:RimJ/RimL family protein N-acetyltransferase
MKDKSQFSFKPVDEKLQQLIHEWIAQEHIHEWLHGEGLKNTIEDLGLFIHKETSWATHWVAYNNNIPFTYLITSEVPTSAEHPLKAITLDLFIGNLDYIGKGLSVPMIHEFLINQFPPIDEVHIDPEKRNTRAVHVYKKAGFKIIGEFIAPWHPVPHYKMRLNMADII